jgi:hypothetical protein
MNEPEALEATKLYLEWILQVSQWQRCWSDNDAKGWVFLTPFGWSITVWDDGDIEVNPPSMPKKQVGGPNDGAFKLDRATSM